MHHVGCSSMRYSRDWDLAYVSSPRNLESQYLINENGVDGLTCERGISAEAPS